MSRFKIGAAAAALGLAVALVPAPAQAHTTYAYHGEDWVRVGDEHTGVRVDDEECDGNWAIGRFDYDLSTANGWDYQINVFGGCGKMYYTQLRERVAQFTACEEGEGCSGWKQT